MTDQDLLGMAARARKAQEAVNALGAGKPEFKGTAPIETRTYVQMSLGEVISHLRTLPVTAKVRLSPDIFSYRGYYDRPCVAPTPYVLNGHDLADRLDAYVGKEMYGWKGGDYEILESKLLHVAEEGNTGPSIIGFAPNSTDPNLYEPILLNESYHW